MKKIVKRLMGNKEPIRTVRLRKNGTEIPAPTPIQSGLHVVRVYNPMQAISKFIVGSPREESGVVHSINTAGREPIARVYWSSGEETLELLPSLLAFNDYIEYLKSTGQTYPVVPKFKENQVVYVKPVPTINPSEHFPSINSIYETDVKIIGHTLNSMQTYVYYTIYIPRYGTAKIAEEHLVSYDEKMKYKYRDYTHGIVTVDCEPFFKKDEEVKIFDGSVYNLSETVILEQTPYLNQIIKIKQ